MTISSFIHYFDGNLDVVGKHFIIIVCMFLICTHKVRSQAVSRFNSFSYGVNEGLLQTTISDIEVDKNNFCWISFPNGIQRFDGKNFLNIPVQEGLDDDRFAEFFRSSNGDLLISHTSGISRYDAALDKFFTVHSIKPSMHWPFTFIGEAEGNIYYSNFKGEIFSMSVKNFKLLRSFKTGLELSFQDVTKSAAFSGNIIDNRVALKLDSLIYLVDLKNGRVIHKYVRPGIWHTSLLWLRSSTEVMFLASPEYSSIRYFDFARGSERTKPLEGINATRFHHTGLFPWFNKLLFYSNNRLFELDTALLRIESELVNFQNKPVAGNATIGRIVNDNYGNLYIKTVTGGIRKVIRQNYPVKYYGTLDSNSNHILCVLPDKKHNRVLCGGLGGLFVFDTLQRLIRHFGPDFQGDRFTPNGIFRSYDGSYIVFVTGSSKAYRISKDLSQIKPVSISGGDKKQVDFFGNAIQNNGRNGIFQSQDKLYKIDFMRNKIDAHVFSDAYIMSGILYDGFFISHGKNELIFLDAENFSEVKRIPFSEGAGVRCFATDPEGGLYMGTNKGVFRIDTSGNILQKWNRTSGLPDECIYAIRFDDQGRMWCSTNKGLVRISSDNSLFSISRLDGLQENEFNTNVAAKAEDGELFFGGVNGVSSFFPGHLRSMDDRISLLITGIHSNNRYLFGNSANALNKLELPNRENSLSFDFVAMGNNNPDQYIYQYRMKGLDEGWIHNQNFQTIRYSLSPGKYRLQLYASRQFNKDAVPMKELTVIIRPPFWRTWWFYAILAVAVICLLAFGINFYNRNRYAKKLHALESEHRLKLEKERISRDLHDNLGAYSNAILYSSELLENEEDEQKRKAIVRDLKYASKDIITTLRETIWALNRENYSAEDCLLRVRNFVQIMHRFYPDIFMSVNGFAPAYRTFQSREAFNLVRIIQESFTNSIKHSGCKKILITSEVFSSKWKLTIADDGVGFEVKKEVNSEHGNGLGNMFQRAKESGFEIQISSDESTGTVITLMV